MHVLLVEDERRIAVYVARGLREQGYAVDLVSTGPEALAWAPGKELDAIVLDLMLPGMDGLEVCTRLRKSGCRTPILMLTARDGVDDRVIGLDAGADDYLVKPFALKELFARLRALVRRSTDTARTNLLELADLSVDMRTREVKRGGRAIHLTAKAFAVLECLIREPNRVMTRAQIAEHVWSYDTENASNVVDVYIRNLRRSIDDPFERKLIQTIRGAGYRLSMEDWDDLA